MEIKNLYTIKDESDLELLFKQYYTKLCNIAYHIVNDKNTAEDIVQEAFLRVWENKTKININSTIEGYLVKTVSNISLNHIKKNKNVVFEDAESTLAEALANTKSDQRINYEELHKIVYSALDKLPPKCRTIFVLSRFEEMKNKEIAAYLEVSIKTIDNQMKIAVERLQGNLKETLKHDYVTLIMVLSWLELLDNI